METWIDKADRIILEMCTKSYNQANRLPNGRLRKRHVSYSVPSDAERLIDCLNRDDEEGAKAIFINHAYGIVNTL